MMIRNMIRRNTRQPLAALAVLLFAAVLTVVLCHLHKSGQEELRSFEETYASVPVYFKVTNLDGSIVRGQEGIQGWMVDLFGDRGVKPNLYPYVKEAHLRVSLEGTHYVTDENGKPVKRKKKIYFNGEWYEDSTTFQATKSQNMIGISSTRVAEELTEGWGGKIYWNEGYDESILMTDQFVCILPESMRGHQLIDMEFHWKVMDGRAVLKETWLRKTFQVVGYFSDPGNTNVYCPYPTMEYIHAYLSKAKNVQQVGAILNDNSQLDALRETASLWFADPNPLGEKTPWGRFDFDYYFYAMDVDDTTLTNLEANMKNSMRLNTLASAVVFALSAGAGFLTGFLVIRSRKQEISLMRTMGASQRSIFAELALEQMLCIALGIVLGGSYGLWQPVPRLLLFGGIYFVGLTAALIVFLRKNLLTIIKEEE